ncbi:MAG TPA: ribosome biogenesis GTP-binding protein YihA/YsxC [Gammaproteobacteria bacterium]|nr:ribosome biogenesis GTP-binding protein YihA/YsxC [Gammaproteobacteria bacterium]
MSSDLLRRAVFFRAAARAEQLPADRGREVAFAGRSNAGKSTAINVITGRKGLARTSKTPGRTQQIVFFRLDDDRRLVDLPGYGYARVPDPVRRGWAKLVESYLIGRRSLKGVVLLTDARRPFTQLDLELVKWCAAAAVPVHALLTKCDKLNHSQSALALAQAQRLGASSGAELSLQLFSGLEREGVEAAAEKVRGWLED